MSAGRRFAVALLLFTAANAVIPTALLVALGARGHETMLYPLRGFVRGEQLADSWRPMRKAFTFVTDEDDRASRLYDKMFWHASGKHKGLQYPPTALLPLFGLRAVVGDGWSVALERINWVCVPLTAVLVVALWFRLRPDPPLASGVGLALAGAWVALTLTFFPAMMPYRGGQIQMWLNTLFAAALLAWVAGREVLAGLLLGLAALVKPQLGVLLVWGLWRRRWGFAVAGALTGLAGLGVSLALLGLEPHVAYLDVLRFLSMRGESFFPNQSLNGLLHRALGNGLNLAWTPPGAPDTWMSHFPPYHPLVHVATVVSSVALLAWAFLGRAAAGARGGPVEFSLVALAATVASPIAWEHHYGILLPIFVLLVARLAGEAGVSWRAWVVLAGAYVVASHPWRVFNVLADTPWNFLQSYLFFDALLVLALLQAARAATAGPARRVARAGPARRSSGPS